MNRKEKDFGNWKCPTEKLPEKSHDIPKRERRTVQRGQTLDTPGNQPSTFTALSQKIFSIEDLNKQSQKKSIHPWLTNKSNEDEKCDLNCLMNVTASQSTLL